MLIKQGVDISRLKKPAREAMQAASDLLSALGDEIVVTSTYEGNHMAGSLHYANKALDFTGRYHFRKEYGSILEKKIGPDYDVVIEDDHIHIEYHPKGGD
jgi:hypothetical protein